MDRRNVKVGDLMRDHHGVWWRVSEVDALSYMSEVVGIPAGPSCTPGTRAAMQANARDADCGCPRCVGASAGNGEACR
jgi:hypothetical protein